MGASVHAHKHKTIPDNPITLTHQYVATNDAPWYPIYDLVTWNYDHTWPGSTLRLRQLLPSQNITSS